MLEVLNSTTNPRKPLAVKCSLDFSLLSSGMSKYHLATFVCLGFIVKFNNQNITAVESYVTYHFLAGRASILKPPLKLRGPRQQQLHCAEILFDRWYRGCDLWAQTRYQWLCPEGTTTVPVVVTRGHNHGTSGCYLWPWYQWL